MSVLEVASEAVAWRRHLHAHPELSFQDMERVRDFVPELPELRTSALAIIDPVFLATPGSCRSILEEGGGVWGAPSESTAEKGEEFLGWCTRAVADLVRDLEDVHDRIEPGYLRTRPGR